MNWFGKLQAQVTFTGSARQCLWLAGSRREWITTEALARNVDWFIERLSRDVLGRRQVRKGHLLLYVGVIEGDRVVDYNRMHVHLAIGGIPVGYSLGHIRQRISDRWQSSRWGYNDLQATNLDDDPQSRWNRYMLKEFDPAQSERWITNVPYRQT